MAKREEGKGEGKGWGKKGRERMQKEREELRQKREKGDRTGEMGVGVDGEKRFHPPHIAN